MEEAINETILPILSFTKNDWMFSFWFDKIKMYYNSIYLVDCNKNIEK